MPGSLENHQLLVTESISVAELVEVRQAGGRDTARINVSKIRPKAPLWGVKLVCLGAAPALLPFPLSAIQLLKGPLMPRGVNKPRVEAGDFILSPARFMGWGSC